MRLEEMEEPSCFGGVTADFFAFSLLMSVNSSDTFCCSSLSVPSLCQRGSRLTLRFSPKWCKH